MATAQTPTEKCTNCGEVNSTALPTCNMCGSLLPWVVAKRAAERQSIQEAQELKRAKKQQLKAAPVQVTKSVGQGVAKGFTRLPSYKGLQPATVTLGDIEIPTGQLAALCGALLLALAAFAPITGMGPLVGTLFTFSPWLGGASLCGATVAVYALVRSSYRWCYLAAILGLVGPVVLSYQASQYKDVMISPWRLLQWGVLPLVLGPLACLVAGFFSGKLDEEETVLASQLGEDEAPSFQTLLRQRVKEASQTQVFCQAVAADTDGMKVALQQAATATSWEQVPAELRQVLINAKAEVEEKTDGNLPLAPHLPERKAFAWRRWGTAALLPLFLGLLLFGGIRYNRARTLEPVKVDIGTMEYLIGAKTDPQPTLTTALLTELQEANTTYLRTSKITVAGRIKSAFWNVTIEQELLYDKRNSMLLIMEKHPLVEGGKWKTKSLYHEVGDETLQNLVKEYEAKAGD